MASMSRRRTSNRREFLQGKAAVDALADIRLDSEANEEFVQPAAAHCLIHWARRAMACQFEVFLNAGQYENGAEVALAALDLIDELEDQMSVYRPASEISQLNALAANGPVLGRAALFALLELAVGIFEQTGGAYDITSSPLSKVWGFARRAGAMAAAQELAEAAECVGSQHLQLDRGEAHRALRTSGLEIDLGSIGKGYALDRCAELFRAGEYRRLSSARRQQQRTRAGLGRPNRAAGPWVYATHYGQKKRLGEILLHNAALSTSGSGTQYFMHEGRRYGHILDPRSGWPAEGVLSATVIAPRLPRPKGCRLLFTC